MGEHKLRYGALVLIYFKFTLTNIHCTRQAEIIPPIKSGNSKKKIDCKIIYKRATRRSVEP